MRDTDGRSTLPKEFHDFRNVLFVVWKALGLPEPTPLQYELAHWLQHGNKRQITAAFRGIGKSWITSCFVIWYLAMDIRRNVLVLSASKQRADDFSQFCYRLMELPIFEHLAPRPGQRQSLIAFDVAGAPSSHAPSCRSQGITGQITGGRADLIVADDIEVPGNSWTATMREKLAHLVTDLEAILKPDWPDAKIAYLGTPHTQESLYWHLRELGYAMRMWPARYPADLTVYGGTLAPSIAESCLTDQECVGQPTDPRRFDETELREREGGMGRSAFLMQYMLNTELSDEEKYPLKLRDAIVMDLQFDTAPERVIYSSAPEYTDHELPNVGFRSDRWQKPIDLLGGWAPYDQVIMAIDPSGRGADECAYVVVGFLASTLYVIDWGGYLDGYSVDTLEQLAKTAATYKVHEVVTEANYGDGMWCNLFTPYIQRYNPCTITEVKSTGMKEARILDVLEPAWQQHRIVFNRSRVLSEMGELERRDQPASARDYHLFWQATHLCRESGALHHDDRLDALAIAVAHFVGSLFLSQEEAFQTRLDAVFDLEVERFIEAQGGRVGGDSWLSSTKLLN